MSPTVPQAVQSCHDVLLWLIPQLDKFPRARRFTLGERLETGLQASRRFSVHGSTSSPRTERALKRLGCSVRAEPVEAQGERSVH